MDERESKQIPVPNDTTRIHASSGPLERAIHALPGIIVSSCVENLFDRMQAVVREQCALRWANVAFIPPAGSPQMCDMITHARESLAVHQLPDMDDDAVQYGIRSWLRNRRHEITRISPTLHGEALLIPTGHAEERAWRAAFPRELSDLEFEFNLARLQVFLPFGSSAGGLVTWVLDRLSWRELRRKLSIQIPAISPDYPRTSAENLLSAQMPCSSNRICRS